MSKLRMRLIVACFLLLVCGRVLASDTHKVEILRQDSASILLEIQVSAFGSEAINIMGKEYQIISLPNEGNSTSKGLPSLPYISRSFQIPATKMLKATVLSYETQNFSIAVAPSKGIVFRDQDPLQIPYTFDPFYLSQNSFPETAVELSEPFIIRDLRGITLYYNPFKYSPAKQELEMKSSAVILLEFYDSGEPVNALSSEPIAINREFDPIYQNLFINYNPERYTQVNEVGRLLVISHANFMNGIQSYVNWKRQKGIVTELVQMSTIGSTATQLKNYVQNYYNQNPGLVFVQLVGDSQHIPYATHTWQSSTGAADPDLSLVAGNDNYPDIFVGRFSCETETDLLTQINRSIAYERDMAAGSTWIQRAMGIASNEGGGGQGDMNESDEQHMNIIRNNLLNYGYLSVDQIHESAGATATQISSNINSGRGYINLSLIHI